LKQQFCNNSLATNIILFYHKAAEVTLNSDFRSIIYSIIYYSFEKICGFNSIFNFKIYSYDNSFIIFSRLFSSSGYYSKDIIIGLL